MSVIDTLWKVYNEIFPPIGAFADVTFECSHFKVRTFDEYRRRSKVHYARHDLLNQTQTLEYTGREAESITFSMKLISRWCEPSEEVENLRQLCFNRTRAPLILGGVVIGENDWVIEEVAEEVLHRNAQGRVLAATVEVTLTEARNIAVRN